MPELKKQDNIKVAVTVDGSSFITLEESVLMEYTTDKEAMFYIKNKKGTKEIKIKIFKE